MEFRQLIITQKDTQQRYVFNNRVNLVVSTDLSDELLIPNNSEFETSYLIESEENISIKDVFQIKINIASTGVMMLNFKKDVLSEEQKQQFVQDLSALKDGVEPNDETQKAKIVKVIEIAEKYNPLFVCYANNGDFIFTRSTFEGLLKEKELGFPVLILLNSLDFAEKFQVKTKKKTKKTSVKNVQKSSKLKFDFSAFKNLDFVFFGIFSLFIVFSLTISIFEFQNGEAIAVFLVVLAVIFAAVLTYAIYRSSSEDDEFFKNWKKWIVPILYILLGIGLGAVGGFLVCKFALKVNEDKEVNYALVYALPIIISLVLCISLIWSPILLRPIVRKIKRKK